MEAATGWSLSRPLGARRGGAAAPGELQAEGSSQPRTQVVETISQGAEGNVQSLRQLKERYQVMLESLKERSVQ